MSFGDLHTGAQKLTAAAFEHGLTRGGRLVIATQDSYEAAELFVSAIHAGLPVVPLNVEAGASHLRQVIERGRIDLIIAAPGVVDQATSWCADLADPPSIIESSTVASSQPAPLLDVDPDAEAFIMYTSGSTGVPKGVVLSHRNALAAGENNRSGYEWSSADRVLCPLPFWHMNACDKSLGAMASGATMIVPPRFLVGEFWNWTIAHDPTVMIIVPTIAGELLQHPTPEDPGYERAVAAVRYAGSSSAPLNAAVHDDFVERYGIPMIEAFGMSETGSIFVTTPPPNLGSPGSVGKPAGWEVRIVDTEGQELPVGEAGSLELRGPALTVGYDDTDAFADAVTPDGWFRTGDIGRFNEDSEFFVVGRAKEIVIKGGVNIAPREIDEVVMTHPNVSGPERAKPAWHVRCSFSPTLPGREREGVARSHEGGLSDRGHSDRERRDLCRRTGLAVFFVGASLLASATRAGEVTGLARFFAGQEREADNSRDFRIVTLDARYNRPVSQIFSYLVSVRYTYRGREQLLLTPPLTLVEDQELEPRFEILYSPEWFDLIVGGRFFRQQGNPPDFNVSENNFYGRLVTKSEGWWPVLELDFETRDRSSEISDPFLGPDAAAFDQTNRRLSGLLGYRRPIWRAWIGKRYTQQTSGADNIKRTTDENLFFASVSRTFGQRKAYTLFAQYNLDDNEVREEFPGTVLVPVPRSVAQGLSELDPLPIDGALQPTPELVDGDITTPTPINIGGSVSGGSVGWNMGVELALLENVDVMDVWVTPAIPALNAATYQWAVYTSDDNVTWTPVTNLAGRVYDPLDGRFRLTFPLVTARYVKVVNLTIDDTLGAVSVTEIEPFGQELRSGTATTTSFSQNAVATFTWAPVRTFFARANLSGARVETETPTGLLNTLDNNDGRLTLNYAPNPFFRGIFTAGFNRRMGTLEERGENVYGMTLTAIPLPDLTLTLAASHRNQRRDGQSATTPSYLFRATALLHPDLSIAAEYGEADEQNLGGANRYRETIGFILDTRPRRQIEINSAYRRQNLVVPSLAPELRDQSNITWDNRILFRPSSLLSLSVQGVYFDFPDRNGWSTGVQFDWFPLPGGAVQLTVLYRYDDPLTGLSRRFRSIRARWQLNRKAFLEFAANRSRTEDPVLGDRSISFINGLLQIRF